MTKKEFNTNSKNIKLVSCRAYANGYLCKYYITRGWERKLEQRSIGAKTNSEAIEQLHTELMFI